MLGCGPGHYWGRQSQHLQQDEECSRNQDVDFVLLITSAHINIYRHINAFMGDREREPLAWGRVLTSAGCILTESVKLEGSELFLVSRLSFPLSRKPAVLKQNQIMCWLLFSFLRENIWEKQLKEGLGLQFEQLLSNTAQQEGTAMARQGQGHIAFTFRKLGEMSIGAWLIPCITYRTLVHRLVPSTFGADLSLDKTLETSSQTPWSVSPTWL